MKQGSVE